MEVEEFLASNDQTQIIKRNRTKRHRSSSPFGVSAMSCSSSSGCGGGGGCSRSGRGEKGVAEDYGSTSSPTTSGGGEIYESTEEEEDMANCLIMLAQSEGPRQREQNEKIENLSDGITTVSHRAGFLVYECKTCNRSFPSFQALGGHRASHKKPKAASHEEKKPQILKEDFEDGQLQFNAKNSPPPLPSLSLPVSHNKVTCVTNKANKIHECSICGAEFTSGQALGGHMRRHRTAAATATASTNQVGLITIDTTTSTTTESSQNDNHHEIKPRNNILALDLNLPAPEDDHRGDSKFQFPSTQPSPPPPPLVFSAGPTLVDCHN